MKKIILSIMVLLVAVTVSKAQDKYFTKTGKITFFSSTPMEDIEAHNKTTTSVIDTKTGKMEFATLMKAFDFEKALMQEHFNENYVESDKYPKATFAGAITNLSEVNFKKDGTYNVKVKGTLTLHGVSKEIEAPGKITVSGNQFSATSSFNVAPEDFKIEIPKLVRDNIARQIKIDVKMDYQPLNG